jgi:hypothetical protein
MIFKLGIEIPATRHSTVQKNVVCFILHILITEVGILISTHQTAMYKIQFRCVKYSEAWTEGAIEDKCKIEESVKSRN